MTPAAHSPSEPSSSRENTILIGFLSLMLCVGLSSCAGGGGDPMKTLKSTNKSAATHLDAMARLDGPAPSAAYLEMLEDIMLSNRYLLPVRKAGIWTSRPHSARDAR